MAHGVETPWRGADKLPGYLQECKARQIVPFSGATIKYGANGRGLYVQSGVDPEKPHQEAAVLSVIDGGLQNKIKIDTDGYCHKELFETIRGPLLDRFVSTGYQLTAGKLIVAAYAREYCSGGSSYSDSSVSFNWGVGGVGLSLKIELNPESDALLKNWFAGLKKKHYKPETPKRPERQLI